MLGQTIQSFLLERLGPEGIRQAFIWLQLGAGALIVGGILYARGKSTESRFAVREADLQARRKSAGNSADANRALPASDLASAKMERPATLSLPGIRIDGPPHEILGIRPGAGADEIQRAYRERMKQYHPDKIGRPGTREWVDAQRIAEAINRAKTELLKRAKPSR